MGEYRTDTRKRSSMGPQNLNGSVAPGILYYVETMVNYTIETDREDDGRWIAEVTELPGVLVYGESCEEAIARVQALALRVLADQVEQSVSSKASMTVSFASA